MFILYAVIPLSLTHSFALVSAQVTRPDNFVSFYLVRYISVRTGMNEGMWLPSGDITVQYTVVVYVVYIENEIFSVLVV